MKQFIWIFETSEVWNYCGGATVIIAPDFDSAVMLFQESDPEAKCYRSVREIPGTIKQYYNQDIHWDNGGPFVKIGLNEEPPEGFQATYHNQEGWDTWTLSAHYELKEELLPQKVVSSYNYA